LSNPNAVQQQAARAWRGPCAIDASPEQIERNLQLLGCAVIAAGLGLALVSRGQDSPRHLAAAPGLLLAARLPPLHALLRAGHRLAFCVSGRMDCGGAGHGPAIAWQAGIIGRSAARSGICGKLVEELPGCGYKSSGMSAIGCAGERIRVQTRRPIACTGHHRRQRPGSSGVSQDKVSRDRRDAAVLQPAGQSGAKTRKEPAVGRDLAASQFLQRVQGCGGDHKPRLGSLWPLEADGSRPGHRLQARRLNDLVIIASWSRPWPRPR